LIVSDSTHKGLFQLRFAKVEQLLYRRVLNTKIDKIVGDNIIKHTKNTSKFIKKASKTHQKHIKNTPKTHQKDIKNTSKTHQKHIKNTAKTHQNTLIPFLLVI